MYIKNNKKYIKIISIIRNYIADDKNDIFLMFVLFFIVGAFLFFIKLKIIGYILMFPLFVILTVIFLYLIFSLLVKLSEVIIKYIRPKILYFIDTYLLYK